MNLARFFVLGEKYFFNLMAMGYSPYIPEKGSIRTLTITDKQYDKMEFLVGNLHEQRKNIFCSTYIILKRKKIIQ
ncbi:hypothetical protein FOC93_02800 (plasmid) [Bacillus cereus]|uniref:hypothetical protein n=1 Tax=Bacillus cereus TaxID=1396 RepID=UPI00156016FF|nr:hypothetical protein [Bacillus cereus]QKH05120.1 hypothetical protein FOC93_02800 [Bacillus cereus]QKH11020.1 hypothetical protein FOC92_03325 [Bacillus cereus]